MVEEKEDPGSDSEVEEDNGNLLMMFLAALAAIYLPLVTESVSATLEFRHK